MVWTALLCGALGLSGRVPAAAADNPPSSWSPPPGISSAADTPPTPRMSSLRECHLEHPLRIAVVAARCGTLAVPEDPTHPGGAAIDLSVAVVPALNRRAAAPPLFLLAGGPGQAAADLYASNAGAFARVNRNHDIVLVDQRGTGRSAPLKCAYPDDWESAPDDMLMLRRATLACLGKFGDRVRFYTTGAAVGDLDQVRAALGYAAIDLYGSSYGTRVAQLYMRRYPRRVHAVILDGVTYPEQAIGPDTPSDGERALYLIVARCENEPECAAAYPALRQELDGLRHRFGPGKEALTVADPGSGQPLRVEFSRGMLNAALRFLSYSATEASLLPTLLHQGAGGNLAPLAAQAIMMGRQVGDQLASGMQNSVICTEDEPLFTASSIDRRRVAQTYQGSDQLDALAEICTHWPRGRMDPDLHAPLHSDIPTLLLSGDADPVTPPADAARAARGLTHHRTLVVPGEGHGQLATGCMPKLMARFLEDAAPETLDAGCLASHRPPPFFVGSTGPAP
ncbi:MAG TPA: alpha/beta hydrolase [Steroidobacteraceae bacterium]|nr:alpha/beta hydrolase [Steroidobacteraceae bacterium]